MNKFIEFARLPDDFVTVLLNDLLAWRDIARLDSALCCHALRSNFLQKVSTIPHPNKRWKDVFIDRYLDWFNQPGVTCFCKDGAGRLKNFDIGNSLSFNSIVKIEATCYKEASLDFVNKLWKYCVNIETVDFQPFCNVDRSRTDEGVMVDPWRGERKIKVTPLTLLFGSCPQLLHLSTFIRTLTPAEADSVPRNLKVLTLSGDCYSAHCADLVARMIDHLQALEEVSFETEAWWFPPSLYSAIARSRNTLTYFSYRKTAGCAGMEVMVQQCKHLQVLIMGTCIDMTQEAFTHIFELPSLEYLDIANNSTISGLLANYHSTSPVEEVSVTSFRGILTSDEEGRRLLDACPHARTGSVRKTVRDEVVHSHPVWLALSNN